MIHRATPVRAKSEFATNPDDDPDLIGPAMAGTLMTPQEFDSLESERWNELFKYELINGVLIVTPAPDEAERGPNELIGFLLRTYRERHPQGSAMNYTLSEHMIRAQGDRRRCDRVVWASLGRKPNTKRDTPTIAIELVSRGKRNRLRDYVAKREQYVEAGIVEYWIVDRFRRTLTVVRRDEQGTIDERTITENETYTTPLLPGFELPLSAVLAEADWLAAQDPADEDTIE